MVIQPSQNCLVILFEPSWHIGPGWWEAGVVWNRVDLIEQRPLDLGERRFLDQALVRWRWPLLRNR